MNLGVWRHLYRPGVALLLLAGFGLRVFRLDLQSIWSDEGLSIYRATQSISDIPEVSAAGIHPPLYDTLLHFWIMLAGGREFSTRFLSVFFGVLALAVLFQVGRLLLDRKGAMLATLAAAVAPFLVYYSQETRMYAPALFFSLLSVLAAVRWLLPPAPNRWLVVYVLAAAAAAYSHYYSWLVVGCLNLFVLLWAVSSGRWKMGSLQTWGAAQIALALAYAPWVGVLLDKYQTYLTPGSRTGPATIIYQTMVSFGLSYSAGQAGATPGQIDLTEDHWRVFALAAALAGIAAWGGISGILNRRGRPLSLQWLFLPLYLILPVIGILLLSWDKRDFAPRYLIFAAPAHYLLIGQGLASLLADRRALQRAVAGLGLLLLLGGSSMSLYNYYYDPTYWRDDVRGVVNFLNDESRSGDAVVLNARYLKPSFDYYYEGNAPVIGLPSQTPADWEQDSRVMEELEQKYERLWLVLWQAYYTDPDGLVQDWLDRRGFQFQAVRFRGPFTVVGYLTHPPVGDPQTGTSVGLELGHVIRLEGYDIESNRVCAGEELPFKLYWRSLQPVSVDYTVFVHLVDTDGKTWAQGDSPPSGGAFPTSRWPVGPLVTDEHRIALARTLPPGNYFLEIGMYDINTMKRLGEGNPEPFQTTLGPIEIAQGGCKTPAVSRQREW